jgi:tetratricopeptide (TPR) repeat protein
MTRGRRLVRRRVYDRRAVRGMQGGLAPLTLHVVHSPSCVHARPARWRPIPVRRPLDVRPLPSSPPRFADTYFGAQRAKLLAATAVLFVPFAFIGYLLCLMYEVTGWSQLGVVVAFGAGAATAAVRFATQISWFAAQLVARFIAPSGSTTPYEYGYSYQQALAAKGDTAGALESYEAVLRESPHALEAHMQAAELYATSGNAVRAIELFKGVRSIPGATSQRIVYASNRLVDLYLAGNDQGRALVELRRLIEEHPGTDTARRARQALGRLKNRPASDAPASSR